MPRAIDEQLTKYLTDVHSIEEQALEQLRTAPKIAGDAELERVFLEHLAETEDQERRVRGHLGARGGDASRIKDLVARAGGVGMVLFARSQPDTPGKLVAHAYSYEHMEMAAYDLLAIAADCAGDRETVDLAGSIRAQENAMATRLADRFDLAVDASVRPVGDEGAGEQLTNYLADAHAIEEQAMRLLEKGRAIAGQSDLARVFSDHLAETLRHQSVVRARLEARGCEPSRLKDAAMRVGAFNLGAFFSAQPDTPAKLAGFTFAFEHLEVGGYEQLGRVAARAGDTETARVAERIIADERAAAAAIHRQFRAVMEASLTAQSVA